MPTFDPSAPTLAREFSGHAIAAPTVFAKGSKLSEAEAAWANSMLATTIGNRFGAAIRAGKTFADPQAAFNDMFAAYKLGESNRVGGTVGGKPTDLLTLTLRNLAEAEVTARIVAKGKTVSEFKKRKVLVDGSPVSHFTALVNQAIAEDRYDLKARAEAQVASMAPVEDDGLDEFEAAPEEAAPETATEEAPATDEAA